MNTAQLSAADVPANNAAEITVGPFQWIPTHVGHECIFMIVSSTGDASNVNNISGGDSIPEWRLVPNDNNIGQRNVFPVSGGGTSGLTADFNRFTFQLKNPHLTSAAMEVRTVLPSFLQKREWKLDFLNRGGNSFRLAPGETRDLIIRLAPGGEFSPSDVAASPDRAIHIHGYAAGILVGGMTYEVDPELKPPAPSQGGTNPQCDKIGEELLRCIQVSGKKVCRVSIRKVTVDLEIEKQGDECGD